MRGLRLVNLILVGLLSVGVLAACDDSSESGGSKGAAMGPDRTEGKVEEAKLREFIPLFPAAPEGYERAPDPGVYVSDTQSTISYLYRKGEEMFAVTFVFSNKNTEENLKMMADPQTLKTWGFKVVDVAGRKALSAEQRGLGKADYLVVVSNSRNVTISPSSNTLPDPAVVKKVFEGIDFAAFAAKD